jgi:hypothetical protein
MNGEIENLAIRENKKGRLLLVDSFVSEEIQVSTFNNCS